MKMQYFRYILFSIAIFIITSGTVFASELRERTYLHTDKQLYLAGELLWMKMYVTDTEGKPLSFSKVGYVELLEGTIAHAQVKLDITKATGEGWIEIPATLPTGNYRLVAYTRNMKNEGEEIFFTKTISIINTFRSDESIEVDTLIYSVTPSVLDNNISVTTDRNSYSYRTRNNIQISGLPEDVHSIGISIAGKDLVTVEETNISRWHTHLSRMPKPSFKELFTPEYEGHIIRGNITNIHSGELATIETIFPLAGFIGDQIRLFGGQLIGSNQVEFYTTRTKGTYELATTSFTAMENDFRINIESPFFSHTEKGTPPFQINQKWEEQLTKQAIGLQVRHAYIADSMSRVDTTYAHFQWKPDRSYILDEYTRFTRMDEVIIEFIPSLRFRKFNNKRILSVLNEEGTSFSIGNSMVLLDGIPITDHELIFNYNPLLLYRIDVYKSKFIFGNQYYNGLVFMRTYKKDYPTLVLDDNTQIYDYEGTQAHRHFYAPSYQTESERNSRIPDYRHTLLWKPEIETNGSSSVTIPFSTSDLPGEYHVTIEGLTKEGKPIRGFTRFKVE